MTSTAAGCFNPDASGNQSGGGGSPAPPLVCKPEALTCSYVTSKEGPTSVTLPQQLSALSPPPASTVCSAVSEPGTFGATETTVWYVTRWADPSSLFAHYTSSLRAAGFEVVDVSMECRSQLTFRMGNVKGWFETYDNIVYFSASIGP
jgi:hypothetical protein